jgi:hypothetical protein
MVYADGSTFQGQFVIDTAHGVGTHTDRTGAHYEGQFSAGKKHGTGRMVYPDGTVYDGNWKDNRHHDRDQATLLVGNQGRGRGRLPEACFSFVQSGDIYQGPFIAGKIDGDGTWKFARTGKVEKVRTSNMNTVEWLDRAPVPQF